MAARKTVFGESWARRARAIANASWAKEVVGSLDAEGGVYLATLRMWFSRFPLDGKHKEGLASRMESFENEDHLGAVNELAWWRFMQREQFHVAPIPTADFPTPDFAVRTPSEFFVEVSTLNVSAKDQCKFKAGASVELDHGETLRRILGKLTHQKQNQLSYAANQKRPGALVLFDYTTWSAFGTQFYRHLADFLLGKQRGFQGLPVELSALVYVERKVFEGRIAISQLRSAMYYNPYATYPLPVGTVASLNQVWSQMVDSKSASAEGWLWL